MTVLHSAHVGGGDQAWFILNLLCL